MHCTDLQNKVIKRKPYKFFFVMEKCDKFFFLNNKKHLIRKVLHFDLKLKILSKKKVV